MDEQHDRIKYQKRLFSILKRSTSTPISAIFETILFQMLLFFKRFFLEQFIQQSIYFFLHSCVSSIFQTISFFVLFF